MYTPTMYIPAIFIAKVTMVCIHQVLKKYFKISLCSFTEFRSNNEPPGTEGGATQRLLHREFPAAIPRARYPRSRHRGSAGGRGWRHVEHRAARRAAGQVV